jgi:hypothetical protein
MMTMKADLMAELLKGWVTPIDALQKCNCFSLSQRCGEFRREHDNTFPFTNYSKRPPMIIDKWVKLPNGKRVKAYRAIK